MFLRNRLSIRRRRTTSAPRKASINTAPGILQHSDNSTNNRRSNSTGRRNTMSTSEKAADSKKVDYVTERRHSDIVPRRRRSSGSGKTSRDSRRNDKIDVDFISLLQVNQNPPVNVVKHLLKLATPESIQQVNNYGWVPLHVACKVNTSEELIAALVSANPTSLCHRDQLSRNPLHFLFMREDHFHLTKTMIQIVTLQRKEDTETELSPAAWKECRRRIISEAITARDKQGFLPIHYACQSRIPIPALQAYVEISPAALLQKDGNGKYPTEHMMEGPEKLFSVLSSILSDKAFRKITKDPEDFLQFLRYFTRNVRKIDNSSLGINQSERISIFHVYDSLLIEDVVVMNQVEVKQSLKGAPEWLVSHISRSPWVYDLFRKITRRRSSAGDTRSVAEDKTSYPKSTPIRRNSAIDGFKTGATSAMFRSLQQIV